MYTPTQKAQKERLRTWIEIDKKAIAHNYRQFRKYVGKRTKMLGMVKSNAYGHNLTEFSQELEKLGIDWLGVDSLVEGIRLRKEGIKAPILVLGFTLPSMYEDARKAQIAITLSSFEMLEHMLTLSKGKKKLMVHVKVDTGMHRQGFQWGQHEKLVELLKQKRSLERIHVEGLYTHFAEAKNPRLAENTNKQVWRFEEWKNYFLEHGLHVLVHAAATGGTLLYREGYCDMVRIGIGLYGLWPSKSIEDHMSKQFSLKPVLAWKAVVGEVKDVKRDERIGYDFTELLVRDTKVAIVPIGYWHGFRRALSGKGRVLIHGKSARVLGRVSMDMIAVDVTEIPNVKMGTEVVLIGKSGKEEIKAGELADMIGTTHYEVVTTLNPLIKKFYI